MSGPTLALIHGLGCTRRAWDRVVPLLQTRGLDATPIEVPGYGLESAAPTPTTIEAMAAAVAPRVAELGDDVLVVGHSMGGLVATAVAERSPAWLRGIVAINSSLTVASRMTAHRGSEGLISRPLVGRIAWALAPRSRLRSGLASAFAPGFDVPDQFVDDLRACSWSTFTRSTAAVDAYLAAGALPDRLKALELPVSLVFGMRDQRLDFGVVAAVRGQHAFSIVEIPESGHTPMWETPEQAAAAIAGAADPGAAGVRSSLAG